MSSVLGRLASNDSTELTDFDTHALGYAGLIVAEIGILFNAITLGILSCSLLQDLHLYIGENASKIQKYSLSQYTDNMVYVL